jgi:hypothetical protein
MTTGYISTKAELKMLHPCRGSNQNRPLRQWRLDSRHIGYSLERAGPATTCKHFVRLPFKYQGRNSVEIGVSESQMRSQSDATATELSHKVCPCSYNDPVLCSFPCQNGEPRAPTKR